MAIRTLQTGVGLLGGIQWTRSGVDHLAMSLGGVYIEMREYRISIYWCDFEQGRHGTNGEEFPRPVRS